MFKLLIGVLLVTIAQGVPLSEPQQVQDGLNRIQNGELAKDGEFPSHLSLQNNRVHICVASILNKEWALTTANCVYGINIKDISLFSGSVDLLSESGTVHNASKIVTHPGFVPLNLKINDIAVIKVKQPFKLDGVLRKPITLPEINSIPSVSARGTIAGWGVHRERAGMPSQQLYKADVSVAVFEDCSESFHLETGSYLDPTQMCTKIPEDGTGSCYGDQGGPLVIEGVAAGLISYAVACETPQREYTVHTQVAPFVGWIINSIA